MSESYLNFHLFRSGRHDEFKTRNPNEMNRELRKLLIGEGEEPTGLDTFSKTGALCDAVCGALSQYKLGAIKSKSKWRDVIRGKASLPTFRNNMAIPIRCDDTPEFRTKSKTPRRRMERLDSGDVELDLVIRRQPYPRIVLATGKLHDGERAILNRLLDNSDQLMAGYRQRCFEIKHDERQNIWWLYVTYDFPAEPVKQSDTPIVVGVDLGFACPLYAAISNGHARLGYRQFAAIAARIRSLQTQTMARRRQMLTGGRSSLTADTARSGHGRRRHLQPIEKLEGRIHDAYTTLNHQLSKAVVDFAANHGASVVQIEDLTGLKEHLTGSFLGARWRYHQLQQFLEYKCEQAGITLRKMNPRNTSKRCSKCGHINHDFTRAFRDRNRTSFGTTRFTCAKCEFTCDPDYNAARNLAILDIDKIIATQVQAQGNRSRVGHRWGWRKTEEQFPRWFTTSTKNNLAHMPKNSTACLPIHSRDNRTIKKHLVLQVFHPVNGYKHRILRMVL
ncbi:MAG: transposase [Pirellulales bacterium]